MRSTMSALSEPIDTPRVRASSPIRSYLFALVVLAILPLLLFTGLVVAQQAKAVQTATRDQMTTTVRALALAIDSDVANAQAFLTVMASAPALSAGDVAAFRAQCAAFADGYQTRILLAEEDRTIFDTGQPPGAELAPPPALVGRTLETGRAQISGYDSGPDGRPGVLVAVPLARSGRPGEVLAIWMDLGHFSTLLEQQRTPSGWVAEISDRRGIILARSTAAARFVGRPEAAGLPRREAGEEGIIDTRTADGNPAQAAFTRAPLSGWTVTLALPTAMLGAERQESLLAVLGGGTLLLTLAGFAAWAVAWWIVRQVARLAEAAAALGRGERLPPFESGPTELQAVARELRHAGELVVRREEERDRNQAELRALATHLEARVAERTAALEAKSVELVWANEAEQAASRAKTGFLAAASHDLRQPLHAASLFAAALARRVEGVEALRLVASIGEATKTMQGMLDALLDVSRLDGGVMEPYPEWFCIEDMFARLRTEFITAAQAKDLDFRMVGCALWVETDPALLESILRNLISNAVKFTSHGKVLVGCRRRGGEVRIEVHDTGIGIPKDKIDAAFQEFQRLGGPEQRQPGLGLGLAIVRRLADLLRLKLEVASTVGRGSCFAVELPCAVRARVRPAAEPGEVEIAGPRTVLVIDDNPLARAALARELTDWGCRVLEAGAGEEAVALLAEAGDSLPDLIITDLDLDGGVNGLDLLARLAASHGIAVPTIVITGDTRPDTLAELKESGHPWLIKPVDAAALRRAAAALLSAALQ